ncbi:FAD/NAD(P)-binding oxidoreductase [Acaryochloris sp. IP29b_bin.137]|uniref:NAD(P)/FAD-dependent oxidoreductase n=1 Tax=Acaryochloris sp. IP29b_bin.137 TaxID=2969217 RepID=UPI002635A56F|nr:FAD/NAD(P)-binding oxidoreductase [Acaryochloris sp. IP29b_bin.137]
MTATQTAAEKTSQPPISHQIVIVGGGAAGITVAAQLLKQMRSLDILIIEPSDQHYYQPGWTLVGGGCIPFEATVQPQQTLIPPEVTWLQDTVVQFEPDQNRLHTQHGTPVIYDYLVICPGIQINWDQIKGLPEALGNGGVCSNYAVGGAAYTWETIQKFPGGNAIFTYPATPIKCAGAPQKIMYLAEEAFSRRGIRQNSQISYCTATGKIFGVDVYVPALMDVVKRKGINLKTQHNLTEIHPDEKVAIFAVSNGTETETISLPYDMIHVAPPMSAPDVIRHSPLAVEGPGGWVDVDQYTTQHHRYPNIFSLGDASSLPTSKTAAAIRREAPVLVQNLLSHMNQAPLTGQYNGYSCCPLITGYDKTILAEFDYEAQPYPSFPLDSTQERSSMWFLKRHVLPWVYWNRMLKGEEHEGDIIRRVLPDRMFDRS